ncbi:407_t:CDS:2, partial [Funneliformis geosporum]
GLQEPEMHALFYGPPGSGKSYLAEMFARNESLSYINANFGFELYVGSNQVKVNKVMEHAEYLLKLKGNEKPVVIIIDEIDSIGTKSDISHSSKQEVNALLTMIDNIKSKKLNIIVIGITNYPDALDSALKRAGRLGRQIEVPYLTREEITKMVKCLESDMKKDKEGSYKHEGNKSNFWSEVLQITFENFEKCKQAKVGISYTDLEMSIKGALAKKVSKDSKKITPQSADFKAELEKKVDDKIRDKPEPRQPTPQPSGLFWAGPTKGSFGLPPRGYALWKNIQTILDHKFSRRGIQNVLLPTLIPFDLISKEKDHIAGFSPECFYVEKVGAKKLTSPLVLRPTIFRAEKNTNPFFRNTEFLWQEGHTIHISETEAQQFALDSLADYQDYAEKILNLAVIVGHKTEGEKFAGALETYTVECLLPDGQCLQLATSHYFGDHFCRLMEVKYQDKDNLFQFPYSTSWGTSTRAIGAIIAFILFQETPELINYYQEIFSSLSPYYRCKLYNQGKKNLLQADEEGCPFKILLGPEELEKREITLVRRDDIERRIPIKLAEATELEKKMLLIHEELTEKSNKLFFPHHSAAKLAEEKTKMVKTIQKGYQTGKLFAIINQEAKKFRQNIYQKSVEFRDSHIYKVDSFTELEKKLRGGVIGLFLVPFCHNLECEKKIKVQDKHYVGQAKSLGVRLNQHFSNGKDELDALEKQKIEEYNAFVP